MPLRKKILASMVIPALLLCTVGMVGISSLHFLRQAAGKILSHNYQSIEEARRMERALRLLETSVLAGGPISAAPLPIAFYSPSSVLCSGVKAT